MGHSPTPRSPQSFMRRYRTVLALVALLGGLLLAVAARGHDGIVWDMLAELGLFAAASVAIPFYYSLFLRDEDQRAFRAEISELLDEKLARERESGAGVTVRAEGRMNPAAKAAFLYEAATEVWEVGLSLRSLVGYFDQRPADEFAAPVRRLLASGVDFVFVLMDPDAPVFRLHADSSGEPQLPERASASMRRLKEIAAQCAADGLPGTISVRLAQQLPTCNLLMVDPRGPAGRCLATPYLAGIRRADTPVAEVRRSAHPRLFEAYTAYAEAMLGSSNPA